MSTVNVPAWLVGSRCLVVAITCGTGRLKLNEALREVTSLAPGHSKKVTWSGGSGAQESSELPGDPLKTADTWALHYVFRIRIFGCRVWEMLFNKLPGGCGKTRAGNQGPSVFELSWGVAPSLPPSKHVAAQASWRVCRMASREACWVQLGELCLPGRLTVCFWTLLQWL